MISKLFSFVLFFLTFNTFIYCQTIRINEFSQGANGSREWVELVVTSSSPVNSSNCSSTRLNISGWILDDNNGDFSPPNHYSGSGIATGHMRFKNQPPWNSLPVGAIIVIYNSAEKDLVSNFPADDPFDFNNNDCVYVLPSNHPSLEYCSNSPAALSCDANTSYSSCLYGSGSWLNIGLANLGDAIQIRNPSYQLVHGVVYGATESKTNCPTTPDMVGNALAPAISNSPMDNQSATFIGTTDADYFDKTKWLLQNYSLATPGDFNNTSNRDLIVNTYRGGCSCLKLLPFTNIKLNGRIQNGQVKLYWKKDNELYYIEKSTNLYNWVVLGQTIDNYFYDTKPSPINFYRLKDNNIGYSNVFQIRIKPISKVCYFDFLGRKIDNLDLLENNSIFIEVIDGFPVKRIKL